MTTNMIEGKVPEITIKFNQKIELPPEPQKVTVKIQTENNLVVKAELKYKTLRKQVAKMEELEDWVGALSGKIKKISSKGVIELEGAGLQVFEKKKKEAAQSSEVNESAA